MKEAHSSFPPKSSDELTMYIFCMCVTSSDSSFIFSLRCVSINWNGQFFLPSNIDVLLEMQWAWASIKNKCRWKRKRQSSKCDYSVDPIQSVAVLGSVLNDLFNDIGACSFIRLPNSLMYGSVARVVQHFETKAILPCEKIDILYKGLKEIWLDAFVVITFFLAFQWFCHVLEFIIPTYCKLYNINPHTTLAIWCFI